MAAFSAAIAAAAFRLEAEPADLGADGAALAAFDFGVDPSAVDPCRLILVTALGVSGSKAWGGREGAGASLSGATGFAETDGAAETAGLTGTAGVAICGGGAAGAGAGEGAGAAGVEAGADGDTSVSGCEIGGSGVEVDWARAGAMKPARVSARPRVNFPAERIEDILRAGPRDAQEKIKKRAHAGQQDHKDQPADLRG